MREVFFSYIGPYLIYKEAKDMDEKERQERIMAHLRKFDEDSLKWQEEEFKRWEETRKEFETREIGV